MDLNLQFRHGRKRSAFKFLLVIKLIVLVLTTAVLQVSAHTFVHKITINKTNTTLQAIINEIRTQTGYDFLYNNRLLKKAKSLSINVKSATIEEVLSICLADQGISYKVDANAVWLRAKPKTSLNLLNHGVAERISGKIVDEKGQPLPGVTIMEKGTANAVQTKENGNFSITVADKSSILVISYIGFKTREVVAGSIGVNAIILSSSQEDLNEVVVTAYGTVKKQNLTDAISSIDSKQLQDRPIRSLAEGLKGLAPGLNIAMNTGAPEISPSINIRGFTNLSSAGGPLILVDGVERPIQEVNPNDVENISVLKDGAASVIYGSRAPYGVILITTKSGKNGKLVVDYTSNYKFTSPAMLPQINDTYTWATLQNALAKATPNGTGVALFSDLTLQRILAHAAGDYDNPVFAGIARKYVINGSLPDPSSNFGFGRYTSFGTDSYQDEYFRTNVPSNEQNLSFSGGSDRVKFYVGLGYNKSEGIFKLVDNQYQRYNALTKINFKATSWLDFDASLNYARANALGPMINSNNSDYFTLFSTIGREFYNIPIKNPDNEYYYNSVVNLQYFRSGQVTSQANDLTFSGGFNLRPLEGLKISGSYNFKNRNTQQESLTKLVYAFTNSVVAPGLRSPTSSSDRKTFGGDNYRFGNLVAEYTKNIAEDHHFLIQAGAQTEEYDFSSLSGSGSNLFAADIAPSINSASGPYTAGDRLRNYTTLGYYGVFTYDYKEKYLLKLAGRADASSRFAPGARWGYFPAVSVAWNVAKEGFWKSNNYINQLKPRVSWSKSGDLASAGAENYYTYLPTLPGTTSTTTLLGGNLNTYLNPGGLVSSDLTWAKPTVLDFGIDLVGLKNRLSITADWYQRTVYDQADLPKILPQTLGTGAPFANTAVSETRGWELNVGWRDSFKVAGEEFNYGLSYLMSDYVGYIVKYAKGPGTLSSLYPGALFGQNYVYGSAGIVQNSGDLKNRVLNSEYTYPGYITYKDLNGDGVINGIDGASYLQSGDSKKAGFNYPRKSFSILPSISWRNFNVSAIFEGVMQWKMYVNDPYVFGSNGNQFFSPFYKQSTDLGYWTPSNPNAFFPSLNPTLPLANDQYLLNLAHLRVRNVTVGYNLPKKWLDRIKLQKVNIFLSGENLGFIYNKAFVKYDPALLSITGQTTALTSGVGYPPLRTYAFGLNISL